MVISKSKLTDLINKKPDCFVQEIKAKKYSHIYGDSYTYINENFNGINFSEKCYKFINGLDKIGKCKICSNDTNFISFFSGYRNYCSLRCSYKDNDRVDKIKATKLSKYGDENYNNMEKYEHTMNLLYNIPHNFSGQYGNRMCDKTKIENHGSLSYNNIDKMRKSCVKKYGVDNFSKTKEFRLIQSKKLKNPYYQKKMTDGVITKYGVRNATQIPEIAEKCQSGKWYEYILPSGNKIKLQGYEPIALDILLEKYSESDIKWKKSDMPEIWYNNGKNRYYPDFYIKKDNLVVEVKSEYTLNRDKDVNELKFFTTKKMGYNFKLMVL